MGSQQLGERERELLRVVGVMVDEGLEFVVVGGHAVSALGRHRFSTDCDVVVRKAEVENFDRILRAEGFVSGKGRNQLDETYGGEFVRYSKSVHGYPISVDLLVNSLVCRNTDAAWSYEYIREHSQWATIPGSSTAVECRTADRELTVAFKIHAGRKTDVRDVVVLAQEADVRAIASHLRRGDLEELRRQIDRMLGALDDERLLDSLKGVFRLEGEVKGQIRRAKSLISSLRDYL